MHRFTRIKNNHYEYRGIDIIITFDENNNTSMLAKTEDTSDIPVQFYSFGRDFEKVKRTIINKVDTYLDSQATNKTEDEQKGT